MRRREAIKIIAGSTVSWSLGAQAQQPPRIKRVGVLKTHRKLGLGIPLVEALESEARRRGYAGVQLGVRADQPRLMAFWSSLGYSLAEDVTLHTVNPLTPPPTMLGYPGPVPPRRRNV